MKTLLALCLLISTSAFAANGEASLNYDCIANTLISNGINIHYKLLPAEIDSLLQISEMEGHDDAVAAAKACEVKAVCSGNLEAQFIAQYDKVQFSDAEAGNPEHMTFGLKNFKSFQPNQTCPLEFDQAVRAQIYLVNIVSAIKNGEAASGVLIYNPKFNQFSIEQ